MIGIERVAVCGADDAHGGEDAAGERSGVGGLAHPVTGAGDREGRDAHALEGREVVDAGRPSSGRCGTSR